MADLVKAICYAVQRKGEKVREGERNGEGGHALLRALYLSGVDRLFNPNCYLKLNQSGNKKSIHRD